MGTPSLSKTITPASVADSGSPAPIPLQERRAASTNAAQTNNDSGNTSETMSLGTTPTTSQTTSTSQLLDSGKSDLENLKPRSPDPVPAARRKPVMLLVEDNPVNMMLLATYMKKSKWEFEKASNGPIAMEAFRKRPGGFDVIFMDVSMPVMTGYESTRHIRMIETERRLAYEHQNLIQTTSPSAYLSYSTNNSAGMLPSSFPFNLPTPTPTPSHLPLRSDSISPTNTSTTNQNTTFPFPAPSQNGLATSPSSFDPSELNSRLDLPSQKDQEMAFEAGVDIFMTKPVRFKEVGRILEGWMKGREEEDGSGTEKIGGEEMLMGNGKEMVGKYRKVGDEKRVVDEDGTGAKRSG